MPGTKISNFWAISGMIVSHLVAFAPLPVVAQSADPHAQISRGDQAFAAEFHIDQDVAQIMYRNSSGAILSTDPVETLDQAAAILADPQMAFAWPALLGWGGENLRALADRAVLRAKRAADGQIAARAPEGRAKMLGFDKRFTAFMQYVGALANAGMEDEAENKIRTEIATPTFSNRAMYTTHLYIVLATLQFEKGAADQAIATLRQAASATSVKAALSNANVNLAAYLARTGKYDEALSLEDKTERDFGQQSSGYLVGHRKLPDSMAYFSAIRACALHGLGRQDEAQHLLAAIDRDQAVSRTVPARNGARLMAISCMHDAPALATELAAQLATAPPASALLLHFQPVTAVPASERETLVAALGSDTLRNAMQGRVRVLDGELKTALAGWPQTTSAR